ncbi:MAG: RNA-binding protein [Methanosarcinales archaeon]|nr:MAG: RNA-binding protein [Methanosarcinales archaeon]
MHIRSRHYLRSNSVKKILKELKKMFDPLDIDAAFKGKRFELLKTGPYDIILVEDAPMIFMPDGKPFLTVKGALSTKPNQRVVVVDTGATRFVVNGADVMRPGIVQADPGIEAGDLVVVVEESHKKALAIGRALVSGDDMSGESGKAIKSIHYVGDTLWNIV